MKAKFILTSLLILAGISLTFSSCNNPVKPVDETEHKHHDMPHRAVFTLTEGKLNGTAFTATGKTQTVIFEQNAEWEVSKTSPSAQFEVRANKDIAYYFEVRYFDEHNDDITGEFLTNDQDMVHQHFFIAQQFVPGAAQDGTVYSQGDEKVYNYLYLDTDPWDKSVAEGAKILGSSNPSGFKGAFQFFVPNLTFVMSVEMMHAKGTKMNELGVYSPYNKPTQHQRTMMDWDIKSSVSFKTIN